jgi:ribA/ribD-fused uncharacterized protein
MVQISPSSFCATKKQADNGFLCKKCGWAIILDFHNDPNLEFITKFRGANRYLSNFWECNVTYQGFRYYSTEHAYQAQKAKNEETKKYIAYLPTPAEAKRYGKKISIRDDWEDVKLKIMEDLVRIKFNENEDLRLKLLETDYMLLIEGNEWGDTFWGFCRGKGENHLGKILMKVRDELRNEQTDE